jgi:hypothetical protein
MAITTTPVAFYRVGGRNDARIDRLRSKDVDVYSDPAFAEICARASSLVHTAGISIWSDRNDAAIVAGTRRRVWALPPNSQYDDAFLRFWLPHPGTTHWHLSAARDMLGSDFLAALRLLNGQFQ